MTPSSQAAALPKLLLISDSLPCHRTYRVALERDFSIISATRGAEGFRRATETCPDVIVLDTTMPGLSGWETCARLKSADATADIPVLLLTRDGADLSVHAMAVGASAFLRKPCSAEALKKAVAAELSSARPQRAARSSLLRRR
jgi:cyclic di-GMP phosphodiesterase